MHGAGGARRRFPRRVLSAAGNMPAIFAHCGRRSGCFYETEMDMRYRQARYGKGDMLGELEIFDRGITSVLS